MDDLVRDSADWFGIPHPDESEPEYPVASDPPQTTTAPSGVDPTQTLKIGTAFPDFPINDMPRRFFNMQKPFYTLVYRVIQEIGEEDWLQLQEAAMQHIAEVSSGTPGAQVRDLQANNEALAYTLQQVQENNLALAANNNDLAAGMEVLHKQVLALGEKMDQRPDQPTQQPAPRPQPPQPLPEPSQEPATPPQSHLRGKGKVNIPEKWTNAERIVLDPDAPPIPNIPPENLAHIKQTMRDEMLQELADANPPDFEDIDPPKVDSESEPAPKAKKSPKKPPVARGKKGGK